MGTMGIKDINIKIRTTYFIDYYVRILVPNSWQDLHSAPFVNLYAASIASDFTWPVFTALLLEGAIFETTDIYELGFSYLYIRIFNGCINKCFTKD